MNSDRLLKDMDSWKKLAEKLDRLPEVNRYDSSDEKEAWTLAHAFADLEESFRTFLHDQLPRLVNGETTAAALNDLLTEIGEEFRHILYHIKDSKFYAYLEASEAGSLDASQGRRDE